MYFASINGYVNEAIVIAIDIYRLSPYVVGASLMHLSLFDCVRVRCMRPGLSVGEVFVTVVFGTGRKRTFMRPFLVSMLIAYELSLLAVVFAGCLVISLSLIQVALVNILSSSGPFHCVSVWSLWLKVLCIE